MPAMGVPFLDLRASYTELRGELDEAVGGTLDRGWYILGPQVADFEGEFGRHTGSKHCVGMGNGLDALHLTLRAWGVGPGDEVLVPSNTYIACWLAVTMAGATPVAVEPDPATHTLDASRVAAAMTRHTKAVMPVHLYGLPCDMDAIRAVVKEKDVRILEDAAQAHGARYKQRPVGSLGDAAAWSFYPSKNLGAYGDAGAVTTDDPALAARLRLLRNYGSPKKYVNDVAGYNSRLDELQAAMLRVRLRHLDAWNTRRKAIAGRYLKELRDAPGVGLPSVPAWADPCWHLFVVTHPKRDALQARLAKAGVETLIHYPIPPHLSGAYRDQPWTPAPGSLPIAERLAQQVLSLPIGPHLPGEAVDQVIDTVRQACQGL
jgi:dTDP-4-amino-4,6-dideoxygalactose transaminase